MRAIILENDILIAEAWDVNWSESDVYFDWKKINDGASLSFRCEHQFLKNLYLKNSEKAKIPACLLICEDLSHKYLYGLQPRNIEYDDFYCKIDFSIDYFLSEEILSEDFNIENKWLKHNRNRRIDEILGS